jgi:hypothetical protein
MNHVFWRSCAKTIDLSVMNDLKEKKITLCLLEKEFLPSLFNIITHLMVHLVVKVEFCGPPYAYLMDVPHGKIHIEVIEYFCSQHGKAQGKHG